MVAFLTRPRGRWLLIAVAAVLGMLYVLATFDAAFLAGIGPFWANPHGPWLMDAAGTQDNVDTLTCLVGYTAFLKEPWHLPVFFVPSLGAPGGTNVIFMDVVPIAALAGKVASGLAGQAVMPYGVWVGLCFVLSAVLAALVMAELGQRSLLAGVAASLLALSAPALLYRFGHMALLGHFEILGALLLYLRDRHLTRYRAAAWSAWLGLALLTHPYLFGMIAPLYAASLLRRRRTMRPRRWLIEPAVVLGVLVAVMAIAGHVGPGIGTSPSAPGFGFDSMNLASPFWPQRSGVFPGQQAIIDATGEQYEGFNYLGIGVLLLVVGAVVLNRARLAAMAKSHRELIVALALLTLFALSHRVFLGPIKLIDLDYSWRVNQIAGVFRSSGRMFWPVGYAIMLGSLGLVLRRLPPSWQVGVVVACCALQLLDTEPLRHRLGVLSGRGIPMLLDEAAWSRRIGEATGLEVYPTFVCSDAPQQVVPNMELQLFAARVGRPNNSVDTSRLHVDCLAEAESLRSGPWRTDTLYVLLSGGSRGFPSGWRPPGLACHVFAQGDWCLGGAVE